MKLSFDAWRDVVVKGLSEDWACPKIHLPVFSDVVLERPTDTSHKCLETPEKNPHSEWMTRWWDGQFSIRTCLCARFVHLWAEQPSSQPLGGRIWCCGAGWLWTWRCPRTTGWASRHLWAPGRHLRGRAGQGKRCQAQWLSSFATEQSERWIWWFLLSHESSWIAM